MFHWEPHYYSIQEDVYSSGDPTLKMDVITCALVESVPLIPGHADGPTLDEGCDEESNGVKPAYTHHTVRENSKAFCRKDAKVEEEDGDLGDT